MLSSKDISVIYETLLSSPGMNDAVKIDLRVTRKNILLLAKVIDAGLSVEDATGLLSVASKETIEELKILSTEILKKAGLTEMNDRLNSLNAR